MYSTGLSILEKITGGVLLNCLLENEEKQVMKEFHEGICGGHHY